MSSQPPASLSQDILKGTKWYVAMRWFIRGLGFISSAILARLLLPEDFGLVAIVLVIFGLVSLLFEFGVNMALIQNNKATDEHFHTAWTIRLLQSLFIAILLAAFSPLIAGFYGDGRLEAICQIMALGSLIRGFENIGAVKLQKDMKFFHDFTYNVAPKIISTLVTIGLAFYYKSYMALVMGMLLNNLIIVLTSYIIVRFKPKFSLAKISEIWGFSQWILIRNLAQYIGSAGDILFLSMISTPAKIGFYKWGTELSSMAITEVQQPFSRVLVPALAKIKDDHDRLIAAYLKALSMMTLISVPITLGFGAVAEELIPLFLGGGAKWLPVVPLIEALVFFAMCTAMYGISGSLLTITGHVKYTAYIYWIQAIITIVTLYPAYYLAELEGVAIARALIGVIMFYVISILVTNKCQVAFSHIINVIWRPVLAGIMMYLALINIYRLIDINDLALLALKIIIGAVFYILLVLLLWRLSGRPATFEATFIQKVKSYVPFLKN